MAYAGESISKKIARAFVYMANVPRGALNKVIALAGHEARDLVLLLGLGLARPEDVTLVDVDRRGLDAAMRIAPAVKTFHGRLKHAPLPTRLDLAVLDWCGSADSADAVESYRHLSPALRHAGATIFLTHMRAHQTPKTRFWRNRSNLGPSVARIISAYDALAMGLGVMTVDQLRSSGKKESDLVLLPVANIDYIGHRMPMSTSAFRVVRYFEYRRAKDPHERDIGRASILQLLRCADVIEGLGVPAAAAFGVTKGRLAAWRAHRTMGTYDA